MVIQNHADYVTEGQLSDQCFYQPLDDLTAEHNMKIIANLDNMLKGGEIIERVARFMVTKEPRTAQLYLLPKVHKNVTLVPGRPIVSANESSTERVSAFVDNFPAPIIKTGRIFIRETSDFLQKLQDIYTNISNNEGTMATLRALHKA